jgi:sugar transferase (PEP-CTERM/EpsH1 system associated)
VVLAYCSGMARLALDPPLDGVPFGLDMVDVDSAKWAALTSTSSFPRSWIYRREANLLGAFEGRAATRAVATMVVTEPERDTLRRLAPRARIEVIGNGVDVASLAPAGPPSELPVVVFCGVMNYAPNVEGARWLAREVWPIVRRARPDARLQIVGADPLDSVRALAGVEGVEVTGSVPDVRPYLWNAAVSAAPLLTARGVQNKVLEALAAGLPVVVTPVVAEGLPEVVRPACPAGPTAERFAQEVLRLLALPGAARRARATAVDLSPLGWDRRLEPVLGLLDEARHA